MTVRDERTLADEFRAAPLCCKSIKSLCVYNIIPAFDHQVFAALDKEFGVNLTAVFLGGALADFVKVHAYYNLLPSKTAFKYQAPPFIHAACNFCVGANVRI